jgi:hypothetical protein
MQVRKQLVAAVLAATAFSGMPAAEAHVQVALVAGGTYTGIIANGLTVAFECTAGGVGDIVSVAITKCQLSTSSINKTIALPGPAAAIGGTATVPIAPFVLCYAAVFTFSDSHTVPLSGCNTLVPNVNGAPQLVGLGFTAA